MKKPKETWEMRLTRWYLHFPILGYWIWVRGKRRVEVLLKNNGGVLPPLHTLSQAEPFIDGIMAIRLLTLYVREAEKQQHQEYIDKNQLELPLKELHATCIDCAVVRPISEMTRCANGEYICTDDHFFSEHHRRKVPRG